MKTIASRRTVFSTPWFQVVSKLIEGDSHPYYALSLPDYVCVVALTNARRLVLVRQYRPAVEELTLELPAGHVDPGETPEHAARRELLEETGYSCDRLELVGDLHADTGGFRTGIGSSQSKG